MHRDAQSACACRQAGATRPDPLLEGSAPRIGWEESCQLAWRRPSHVCMVIARAKYRDAGAADTAEPTIVTAPLPP